MMPAAPIATSGSGPMLFLNADMVLLPGHRWPCACLLREGSPHRPKSSRPPTGSLNNSHCSRTRNLKKGICSIEDGLSVRVVLDQCALPEGRGEIPHLLGQYFLEHLPEREQSSRGIETSPASSERK